MSPTPRSATPLADREREEARLRLAVDACAEGRSTVVEVTGDPGLGKTRLLTELATRGTGERAGRAVRPGLGV
ncbi:ATP-binding protein [Streptomyces sp. V1I1]|uniref:ATP-binding protein n=1 Tax=Streptomyces sp. V1I1 TaxID=3042272 RepID=UPI00277F4796|nr:AAA family ATPase [Streptomyces sp. V1I1]MDQ0938763.1 putative ATPase [Streptomyces sp. V1I1]